MNAWIINGRKLEWEKNWKRDSQFSDRNGRDMYRSYLNTDSVSSDRGHYPILGNGGSMINATD